MDVTLLAYALLGLFSGFFNGLLGAGSGVVIVPVLGIAGFGAGAASASAVAVLMAALPAGLHALFAYRRLPRLSWVPGVVMAISALLTAHVGVSVALAMPPFVSTLMLAFFVYLTLDLFARTERRRRRVGAPKPVVYTEQLLRQYFVRYVVFGSLCGLFGAMVGSAGGLMLVPLLIAFTGMGTKEAIYASLLMMAGSATSAFLGQVTYGSLDYAIGVPMGWAAIVGGSFGVMAIEYVAEDTLRVLLKIFLSELGIFMLVFSFVI